MSDYLDNLRKQVGDTPLIVVAAAAVIHQGRRVLLQRRPSGKWAIHGGGVELGESVEDTVRRELQEEIGLTPLTLKLHRVLSGELTHCQTAEAGEIYCVCVVFLCDEFTGEMKADGDEVLELKWFDIDDLPENINKPVDRAVLSDIAAVLGRG